MMMWGDLWRPGTGWQPASNGSGKRHWFLFRDNADGPRRTYRFDTRGYMIRYASYETAQRAADKLNAAEATS